MLAFIFGLVKLSIKNDYLVCYAQVDVGMFSTLLHGSDGFLEPIQWRIVYSSWHLIIVSFLSWLQKFFILALQHCSCDV